MTHIGHRWCVRIEGQVHQLLAVGACMHGAEDRKWRQEWSAKESQRRRHDERKPKGEPLRAALEGQATSKCRASCNNGLSNTTNAANTASTAVGCRQHTLTARLHHNQLKSARAAAAAPVGRLVGRALCLVLLDLVVDGAG